MFHRWRASERARSREEVGSCPVKIASECANTRVSKTEQFLHIIFQRSILVLSWLSALYPQKMCGEHRRNRRLQLGIRNRDGAGQLFLLWS